MNKRLKNSVLCLLFAICLLFSYCQNTYAAGSVAKVYYFTVGENCLGPGTSSYIVSKLSGMEYSASRYANSSKSTILSAFGNSKVVPILAHGAPGRFVIGDTGTSISYSDINSKYSSLSGLKFVFLESCLIASNSNMQNTLKNLGVSSSLAFKESVFAGSDSDGIHYYAKRVYYHLSYGHTTSYSALKAKVETGEAHDNHFYGSDSYSIYGIDTKLIG